MWALQGYEQLFVPYQNIDKKERSFVVHLYHTPILAGFASIGALQVWAGSVMALVHYNRYITDIYKYTSTNNCSYFFFIHTFFNLSRKNRFYYQFHFTPKMALYGVILSD